VGVADKAAKRLEDAWRTGAGRPRIDEGAYGFARRESACVAAVGLKSTAELPERSLRVGDRLFAHFDPGE
jgi:hypothetical protein